MNGPSASFAPFAPVQFTIDIIKLAGSGCKGDEAGFRSLVCRMGGMYAQDLLANYWAATPDERVNTVAFLDDTIAAAGVEWVHTHNLEVKALEAAKRGFIASVRVCARRGGGGEGDSWAVADAWQRAGTCNATYELAFKHCAHVCCHRCLWWHVHGPDACARP